MNNDIEKNLIIKYNLPLKWADYTPEQEELYIKHVLPQLLPKDLPTSFKNIILKN